MGPLGRLGLKALSVTVLFQSSALRAQDPEPGPDRRYVLFLDRSYIFNTIATRGLIFEGQIAPPLFLFQNTARDAAAVFDTTRFAWLSSWSLAFTPMTRLRMLNEPSSPVRTPSFMPKLDLQFIQLRRSKSGRGMPLSEVEQLPLWLRSLHLTVGHHSNGQEGCLFTDETRIEGECADPVPLPAQREINYQDGSFSTNYFRLALEVARIKLDDNLRLQRMVGFGVAYETNPLKVGPGGINGTLRPIYGPNRGRFTGEVTQRTSGPDGLLRGEAIVETNDSKLTDIPAASVSARLEWTFDRVGGWGAMLRYFRGQDYYNLSFARKLSELQFGIVFDAGRWLEFEIPPRTS